MVVYFFTPNKATGLLYKRLCGDFPAINENQIPVCFLPQINRRRLLQKEFFFKLELVLT